MERLCLVVIFSACSVTSPSESVEGLGDYEESVDDGDTEEDDSGGHIGNREPATQGTTNWVAHYEVGTDNCGISDEVSMIEGDVFAITFSENAMSWGGVSIPLYTWDNDDTPRFSWGSSTQDLEYPCTYEESNTVHGAISDDWTIVIEYSMERVVESYGSIDGCQELFDAPELECTFDFTLTLNAE